jgi:alpha-N-arabinofuranosidase
VNPQATEEKLKIEINGVASLASKASEIVLAGDPGDSNSLAQPEKVIPVTRTVRHVKPGFTYTMPPCSIVVLKLKSRS